MRDEWLQLRARTNASLPRSTIAAALGRGCGARARRASLLPAAARATSSTRDALDQRSAEVRAAPRGADAARAPARALDERRRRSRVRRAASGTSGPASSSSSSRASTPGAARTRIYARRAMDDRARRRAPARPPAARLSARRRPLPVRPAGRDRAEPVRRRAASRSRRRTTSRARTSSPPSRALEAAGGVERWSARRRRRSRARPRASRTRRSSSALSAASSRPPAPAPTAARRSTSGSAARAIRAAEVPARPRRLRARATRLRARGAHRRGVATAALADRRAALHNIRRHAGRELTPGVGGGLPPFRGRARRPSPLPHADGRCRHGRATSSGGASARPSRSTSSRASTTTRMPGCATLVSEPRATLPGLRSCGGGVPPIRARRDGLRAVTAAPRPRPRPPRRRVNHGRLIAGHRSADRRLPARASPSERRSTTTPDPARARPSCGPSIHSSSQSSP